MDINTNIDIEALLMFLAIGAVAGFLAGKLIKGGGFGLVGNIVVGVIGAVLGGWVFGMLGISIGGGLIGSLATALAGAVILLFAVKFIKK